MIEEKEIKEDEEGKSRKRIEREVKYLKEKGGKEGMCEYVDAGFDMSEVGGGNFICERSERIARAFLFLLSLIGFFLLDVYIQFKSLLSETRVMTRYYAYATAIFYVPVEHCPMLQYNGSSCWELAKGGERQKKYCQCFFLLTGRRSKQSWIFKTPES